MSSPLQKPFDTYSTIPFVECFLIPLSYFSPLCFFVISLSGLTFFLFGRSLAVLLLFVTPEDDLCKLSVSLFCCFVVWVWGVVMVVGDMVVGLTHK